MKSGAFMGCLAFGFLVHMMATWITRRDNKKYRCNPVQQLSLDMFFLCWFSQYWQGFLHANIINISSGFLSW